MSLHQDLKIVGVSLMRRRALHSTALQRNTESQIQEKSSAQVAACVLPAVIHKSCGLKPKRKLSSPVPVRYSDSQLKTLDEKAKKAGISRSEYIRALSLQGAYIPALGRDVRIELLNTRRQLTGMATNINQMAYRLNSGNADAQQALVFLEHIREPVLQTLGLVRQVLARGTIEPMP